MKLRLTVAKSASYPGGLGISLNQGASETREILSSKAREEDIEKLKYCGNLLSLLFISHKLVDDQRGEKNKRQPVERDGVC